MKKILTSIFILMFVIKISGQDINNYKYVIIPETFQFTEEVDKYRLNSLTKFLFEQNGFNTVMKTENKPSDLDTDRCLGLHTKLEDNSGLFVTKLVLKLLDCNETVIFESQEGRSREKDFKNAYQEALRDAFSSIEELEYEYVKSAEQEKTPAVEVVAVPAIAASEPSKDVEVDEEEESVADENEILEDTAPVARAERKIKTGSEYLFSGKSYNLKKTNQGLGLYQENSSEPIAILIETNGGESYIYNSLTNQGVAYFDAKGNLIVAYLDRQKNEKISLTYKLQN